MKGEADNEHLGNHVKHIGNVVEHYGNGQNAIITIRKERI